MENTEMTSKALIATLKAHGFSHNRFQRKNSFGPGYHWQDFLMKGDCRIKIENSMVEVEFIQSKNLLKLEGNLLGPFRDGVMFDLDSREMIR